MDKNANLCHANRSMNSHVQEMAWLSGGGGGPVVSKMAWLIVWKVAWETAWLIGWRRPDSMVGDSVAQWLRLPGSLD